MFRNAIIMLVTYHARAHYRCKTPPAISIYRGTMYTAEWHKSLREREFRGVCSADATVHHCVVDLSPMKVVVSRHALQTSMDT